LEVEFEIVDDPISYLDRGDDFSRGQRAAIVNGIGNPLDALWLGATLAVFKASPYKVTMQ
jgi:hypothetical protein